MNLLNLIFNLIEPECKSNWVSQKFSRWQSKKLDKTNSQFRLNNNHSSLYFEAPGAGDIVISESCHESTGQVVGFGFGVEWGRYGFVGGVIGRDEAKRMANFILRKCAETSETMEEERQRLKAERDKYMSSLRHSG